MNNLVKIGENRVCMHQNYLVKYVRLCRLQYYHAVHVVHC